MQDLSHKHLEQRMDRVDEKLDKIMDKFDELEKKYVTRREFQAVYVVFGVVASAIGVIFAIIKSK